MARRSGPAIPTNLAPAYSPPWYKLPAYQAALLFLLAFVLYGNTLGHEFTVDDAVVITDNAFVQRGVEAIPDIFSHDTFYGFFEDESKANLVAGGRYRPLTLALFAVEQALFPGPFVGHLLNVIWYGGLLALLLFWLTDLLRDRGLAWWLPVLVVGLFAAHPIHTEVVANVKGRDEIVSLAAAVGASWLIWRAMRNNNFLGECAGASLLLISCLAKETGFTFIAVIPAVLYWLAPGGVKGTNVSASLRKAGVWAIPAVLGGVLYLLLRAIVLPEATDRPVLELLNNPFVEWTGSAWRELPTSRRLATGCYTLLLYLKLSFWPVGLVHDYYPAAIALRSWSDTGPWLGLLSHLALAAWAVWSSRKHPLIAVGVVIYLAGLSVASNIPFSVGTLLSERFLFFPSLGWAIVIGYGFARAAARFGSRATWPALGLVAIFGVMTVVRNGDWKDNYTLFTTDVRKQPNSAKLRNAAAGALTEHYQALPADAREGQRGLLERAVGHADAAIAVHPTYRNAYLIRGNARLLLEAFDAAIEDYEYVLSLSPGYRPAEANLAIALTAAGRHAGEVEGSVDKALSYLARAEVLRPLDYEVLRLLGVASGVSGQHERALGYFERAAAVRPNDADANWNLGLALHNAGRTEEAKRYFQRAREIRPSIARERGGGS